MSTTPPPLPVDLEAGLRRLRLGAMRALSPELLVVAKTQRWKPEEFLRTLVEAEIASRDASNARGRMKTAAFPVRMTLDEFDVGASSVPQATFHYLASLEWIAARENLCLVGPAGTGKSHLLVALGHLAVEQGRRVRYFTATDLVETLYRGLADNSVGRVIEQILKADLILIDEIGFAPMDDTGAQLFFRIVAAAYERRSLGVGSHWPFELTGEGSCPSTPRPSACSTGSSTTAFSWPPRASHSGSRSHVAGEEVRSSHRVEHHTEG
jgi:DNA replication protein DnaC